MIVHIIYTCAHCQQFIGELDMAEINEAKLGFDCLTLEERQDIIKFDPSGTIFVAAICDDCFEFFQLRQEKLSLSPNYFIH